MNGCYEKNKNFAGTLGGQLMQVLFAFQALSEFTHEEPLAAAEGQEKPAKKCPADILSAPNLITFFATLLKEMKNESGFVIQTS